MRMPRNWLKTHLEGRSPAERLADRIASFCGSWAFLALHAAWFTVWIGFRIEPYPFGLLTMIVSLEAIFLSTIIMISQNRAGDRDRANAQHDYEVNLKAKEEIEGILLLLSRMEEKKIDRILEALGINRV